MSTKGMRSGKVLINTRMQLRCTVHAMEQQCSSTIMCAQLRQCAQHCPLLMTLSMRDSTVTGALVGELMNRVQ